MINIALVGLVVLICILWFELKKANSHIRTLDETFHNLIKSHNGLCDSLDEFQNVVLKNNLKCMKDVRDLAKIITEHIKYGRF